MAKEIKYGIEARDALKRGVDQVVKSVGITLGPKGRNVVIDKSYGAPQIINDGVNIAKEIEYQINLKNWVHNWYEKLQVKLMMSQEMEQLQQRF